MAPTTTEPFLKSCGMSNKEILRCLALKRDEGLLEALKGLFDSPEHLRTFLQEFDLTWFFKDETPPFLSDAGSPPEAAPSSRYLANLKLSRGVEGLGEALRSWCGVRRRAIKKAFKKVADEETFARCFGEIRGIDEFLLWVFETQLATRGETRGLILEPDDIVAFELNKNLIFAVDAKEGLLPLDGEIGQATFRADVLPHSLLMVFLVAYILEGGNFYVGHSQKDRKEFDQKQLRVVERLSTLSGLDLRTAVPESLRAALSARLAELRDPYKISLAIDRCDKYLVYLQEMAGENWNHFRKPEPMRTCPACGTSDSWIGHKCEGCGHCHCRGCVKKSRGNLCQACAEAGVSPVPEPTVREDLEAAAEAARKAEEGSRPSAFDALLSSAAGSVPSPERKSAGSLLDSIAPEPVAVASGGAATSILGIVDLGRETLAGFQTAVRAKFQTVKSVDAATASVPCCGRETALELVELADGKIKYGYCGKCLTAYLATGS